MSRNPQEELAQERDALWARVQQLWSWALAKEESRIRGALHPQYVGWDLSGALPHDREAAVRSVVGDATALQGYELQPLSVQTYGHSVGVVHYTYAATLAAQGEAPRQITGRWSEVYLKLHNEWQLISVTGRPDPSP